MQTTNMLDRDTKPESEYLLGISSRYRVNYIVLILAGISFLALGLRVYCIDCTSLWFDELASLEVAQRGVGSFLTDRFGWMLVQTPLHYLTVWLTLQPLDPTLSSALVRLPSALAGAITPVVVYGLGKILFGRVQGLIAAALVSVSFIHISYSQDVRPYTIFMLFTALSVYCLLMAEQSRLGKWWIAFAAASVLNMLYSYNTLTLVLPVMAPFFLWVLWKLRPRKGESLRPFTYAAGAMFVVALVSILTLLDILSVPRIAPDLRYFSASALVTAPLELSTWFSTSGFGGQLDRVAQALMLLMMILALWPRGQRGVAKGLLLCALFVALPPIILAVLSTTNVVYQRYALFVMPFFFLLVAHGMTRTVSLAVLPGQLAHLSRFSRTFTIVALCFFVAPFALGPVAYAGITSGLATPVIDRPDYRSVSAYLTQEAKPNDIIVFAGWDPTLGLFYWKDMPPAIIFTILDPKLPVQKVAGSIYWVVSYGFALPAALTANARWTKVARFYNVIVYREDPPGGTMLTNLERFLADLEQTNPFTRDAEQVVNNVRGSIYQAQGELDLAAKAYQTAGTQFPIGGEYLRTSKGFAAHGQPERAWRDALISKSLQPQDPQLHLWLATELQVENLPDLSQAESEIARLLETAR
jgi:hypothetical protein